MRRTLPSHQKGNQSLKRILELAVALVLAFVLLIPGLLIWLWVKVSSPGPALFRQLRVGRNQQSFTLYKFRTMAFGAPQAPTHEVSAEQVTSAGRVLRGLKLDEIPQLINVLKGDMSLVGPRPCLTSQSQLIAERQKRGVFAVRPGITGLAQVRGVDMSNPARLAEIDAEYCQTQSFFRDLRILAATFTRRALADRVE